MKDVRAGPVIPGNSIRADSRVEENQGIIRRRATAVGAVFKATVLAGDGWKGVHISDEENKIYWPDQFDQLYVMRQPRNRQANCSKKTV